MEIKDITFAYQDHINRLHHVSSEIKQGEVTTIIGPNGSGKSTLLEVMINHHQPQQGHIMLDGKELNQYKLKELAKTIGVVHQNNIAPADLTVEKLVYYGRLPHKKTFSSYSKEDQDKVEWALKSTGLYDKKQITIDTLSGGQQQRVWIAMALAQDTPLLFLDEPTANLDIYYQYELLELVKQLNEEHGLTIVMVLHDINQAIQYSDAIIVMKQGEIVQKGAPASIISKQLIQEVYSVNVVVKHDTDLGMYIVPLGV